MDPSLDSELLRLAGSYNVPTLASNVPLLSPPFLSPFLCFPAPLTPQLFVWAEHFGRSENAIRIRIAKLTNSAPPRSPPPSYSAATATATAAATPKSKSKSKSKGEATSPSRSSLRSKAAQIALAQTASIKPFNLTAFAIAYEAALAGLTAAYASAATATATATATAAAASPAKSNFISDQKAKYGVNAYAKWTSRDDRVLLDAVRRGFTIPELASMCRFSTVLLSCF